MSVKNNTRGLSSSSFGDVSDVLVKQASPWIATLHMLRDYANYTRPLTYSEWSNLPDYTWKDFSDGRREKVSAGYKAAVLYVQFYEQITLAWYKTRSFYAVDDDGVSTILQYLEKNVKRIQDAPSRFTPAYIYKVAYNCLYCICHDIQRDKNRWENETSNIQSGQDGDEFNLFDTVSNDSDIVESLIAQDKWKACNEIWDMIDDMGTTTKKVVARIMNESSYPPSELNKISQEVLDKVVSELQVKLRPYIDVFLHEEV